MLPVKKMLLFFGCLLSLAHAQAQAPFIRTVNLPQPAADYHYSTLLQDSRGRMWLGARKGLLYFDGVNTFEVALPDSLARTGVSALFEYENQVWAGFQNGSIGTIIHNFEPVPGFEANNAQPFPFFRLLRWTPEEGLPAKPVTGFARDRQGALWIATYGEGLYCKTPKRVYQFNNSDDGLSGDDIYDIIEGPEGEIWAATDAGISICAMNADGAKSVSHIGSAQGLPDEIVTSLYKGQNGRVWIGTYEAGICYLDNGKGQCTPFSTGWNNGPVLNIVVFGDSAVWAGTDRNGLWQSTPSATLLQGRVDALYKDREGLLWAIAEQGKLYNANARFAYWSNALNETQAILSAADGSLWIGSRYGLFLQKNNSATPQLHSPENVISLWQSPTGEVWCGTFGEGVVVFSPNGKRLRHYKADKQTLENGSILSIGGDARRVWLATLSGLSALEFADKTAAPTVRHFPNALGSNYIYKVFQDSKGRVWFGTDGRGLGLFEQDSFKSITNIKGTALKSVYAIAEDAQGRLWFGTDNEGVFSWDGQEYRHFSYQDRVLHRSSVQGLEISADGLVVVAYEDGLDLIDPGHKQHVNFFKTPDGRPISPGFNALTRGSQGEVWIGIKGGLLRCAAFSEPFQRDPVPELRAVSLYGHPLNFTQDQTLDWDDNYLAFNFIGLWYTDPEAVRYRYRLDGLDREWLVGKDHQASYPKLPPGDYTFRVQASEHGNFEEAPEVSWRFSIRPPWWTRWWFIALATAAVLGIALMIVRYREQRMRREAGLRRAQIEAQFETLKSQINPHFLFNSFNTLIATIEENPVLATEYVEHLSDYFRTILHYRERDLIAVQEEIVLVENYSYLLKKRYEDAFVLELRVTPLMERRIMPLSLQILVENAVKHNIVSQKQPLRVEIYNEAENFIVVRNNISPKISPEAGTRFGLEALRRRYRLLGQAEVVVEQDEQYFTVKIPLI